MSQYVCEQCRESVSESANRCPHCGYDPSKPHRRWNWIHSILAILFFFTGIGIPVGYLFWRRAKGHTKKADSASPAVTA